MQYPDFDVMKEVPGYKVILKAVLKYQIQQLVEQLAMETGEESVLLTASVTEGSLSHLGSNTGKIFLDNHDEIKSQFLGFCLKQQRFDEHNMIETSPLPRGKRKNSNSALTKPSEKNINKAAKVRGQGSPRQSQELRESQDGSTEHWNPRMYGTGKSSQNIETADISNIGVINEEHIKVETIINSENEHTENAIPSSLDVAKSLDRRKCILTNVDGTSEPQFQENTGGNGLGLNLNVSESAVIDSSFLYLVGNMHQTDTVITVKEEKMTDSDMEYEIMGIKNAKPSSDNTGQESYSSYADATNVQCDTPGGVALNQDNSPMKVVIDEIDGSRKFPCRYCPKLLTRPALVIRHERIHTGEKPYSCEVCGRRFNTKDNMKTHKFIHLKQFQEIS